MLSSLILCQMCQLQVWLVTFSYLVDAGDIYLNSLIEHHIFIKYIQVYYNYIIRNKH